MNIQLKSLTLTNFKGIRTYVIEFHPESTSIYGYNGTGKSTLFDAFTWLLFGKDSHNAADFNIKTLGPDGNPIHRLEHSVEGVIITDSGTHTMRRTYQEKWVRRRGSETEEMSGHETTYHYNSVPQSAAQYKQVIDSILGEDLFKLLTSPIYFNTLPWKTRRDTLIRMAGDITTESVIGEWAVGEQKDILAIVNGPKSIDDVRKEKSAERKRLRDEIEQIPSRIDEVTRSMPEAEDYEAIEVVIANNRAQIEEIDRAITDQVEAYKQQGAEVQRIQGEINAMRRRMSEIKFNAEQVAVQDVNRVKMERTRLQSDIDMLNTRLATAVNTAASADSDIAMLNRSVDAKLTEWHTLNDTTFTSVAGSAACPTCGAPYSEERLNSERAELEARFEKDKAAKLNRIKEEGQQLKVRVADKTSSKAQAEEQATSIRESISAAQSVLDSLVIPSAPEPILPAEYHDLAEKVATAEAQVTEIPRLNVDGLKEQRSVLQSGIDTLNRKLHTRDHRNQATERIKQLRQQESTLAQQLATIERTDAICERYINGMMGEVERRVNAMFTVVQWRMFERQINGGVEPACECMIDGVPYSDLNSAGKIRAGLDCIATLCRHFDTYAPVWIDNRETIIDIPAIRSQVINLYVSYDKSLTIK